VVDDDPAIRRVAAVYFAHEGNHVDEAEDGARALKLVQANEYDLVIVDRRAAAGAESFLAALARLRPAWGSRTVVAGAPGADGAALRALPRPFSPRDLRAAATEIWAADA
jgi:DNA-binding response OmpR family regulator